MTLFLDWQVVKAALTRPRRKSQTWCKSKVFAGRCWFSQRAILRLAGAPSDIRPSRKMSNALHQPGENERRQSPSMWIPMVWYRIVLYWFYFMNRIIVISKSQHIIAMTTWNQISFNQMTIVTLLMLYYISISISISRKALRMGNAECTMDHTWLTTECGGLMWWHCYLNSN